MDVELLAKCQKKILPEQMLAYVERRLTEWGDWFARGNWKAQPGLKQTLNSGR